MLNPKRILIINLAFIGDVLLSTPVARVLHNTYPEAKIDMLVVPLTEQIAKGNPYINEVLIYDKRGRHRNLSELWKLIRKIRGNKYDMSVATNHASRGAILSWAAGIPIRLGYDTQHAGWFLTHAASAKRIEVRHESENYLDVFKPLGIEVSNTRLEFRLKDVDIASAYKKVQWSSTKSKVGVCPAGSYPRKSLSQEQYIEILRRLILDAEVYLFGSAAERPFLSLLNDAVGGKCNVFAGELSLGELAAFIKELNCLVTVDTGPMHIAQAVKTPVVALFGPTDPRIWGPRGEKDVLFYTKEACSPCWGKGVCNENICLRRIESSAVIAAVQSLLGSRTEGERHII